MLSMTPIRAKNVSFHLPGSTQRASSAPPITTSKATRSLKSPPSKNPRRGGGGDKLKTTPKHSKLTPVAARISSPQPDLIADILDQPEDLQATTKAKKEATWMVKESRVEQSKSVKSEQMITKSISMEAVKSEQIKAAKEVIVAGDNQKSSSKAKQDKKPASSGQCKAKWSKAQKSTITMKTPFPTATTSTTTSGSGERRGSQVAMVAKMALQIRDQTNVACLDYTRWMKHDVAKLREHVMKIEEEIKMGNKAKATLEAHVFDLRKCLSVNQQSVSAQQKKTRKEDGILKRLREETHVLSKSKRRLEQHLAQMKSHLWNLDSMRKTVKSKAANLSRALELDAQRLRVYNGPVVAKVGVGISKQRHYSNSCPLPQNTTGDQAVAQLCCNVVEMIAACKAMRNEMKSMIQSINASKAEVHHKVTYGLAKSVVDTKAHQSNLTLQKGKTRMEQNTLAHQRHIGEIALGVALGPHSENLKSVSEKAERPLSRLRPGSAIVESKSFKEMANTITRQLSASAIRASRVSSSHSKIKKKLRSETMNTEIDLQMLHTRKASMEKH